MSYKLLAPAVLGALLASACGKKTAPPQTEAATPAAPAAAAAPDNSTHALDAPAGPAPKITTVRPRWVAGDSGLSAEIALQGEYLDDKAYVSSSSPLLRVVRLERSSTQTIVFADLDASAPAGDYAFEYLAPGRDPISFKARYDGAKTAGPTSGSRREGR
jgi:hypothetical protein